MRVFAFAALLCSLSTPLFAQGVTVAVDDVTDNRVAAGQFVGSLELRVSLKGAPLEKATAARIVVKEARDDRGTVLYDSATSPQDFTPREYNNGTLQVSVKQPARAASSVRIKGSVELFVPSRDPNSVVKIDKALAKLDTPLSTKALKDAKLAITPLSRPGYAKLLESRKLDEKKIEALRAEGKARGVPDKEIELAIELAKAFEGIDGELPEGAVILSGTKTDFDRIFRVEILGTDGEPINVGSRSTSSRGDAAVMTLHPSEPPPANAALQLFVLTQKSRLTFPFDLNVNLP